MTAKLPIARSYGERGNPGPNTREGGRLESELADLEATQDPDLTLTAIAALGDQGEVAIPPLVNILDTSPRPEHQLAALKALGEIATHSANPRIYDVFIEQLQAQDPLISPTL